MTEAEVEKRGAVPPQPGAARGARRGPRAPRGRPHAKRPGTGISPADLGYVVGRRLAADMEEDDVLRWEDLTA